MFRTLYPLHQLNDSNKRQIKQSFPTTEETILFFAKHFNIRNSKKRLVHKFHKLPAIKQAQLSMKHTLNILNN